MTVLERAEFTGAELTERERQVLEAVVRTYVETADAQLNKRCTKSNTHCTITNTLRGVAFE